ncbi:type III polyketide synthase [Piscibacillus salipiscarius]|uniref:Type III polyketide synthase n=1 Tax=Piscibacillus salipiscarius TaxID=299480 RepID=A0ABW5QF90_9BACI|nr:type III polyketide synthase [Piscibacillus salipiscarius]
MSVIYSIGTAVPKYELKQDRAKEVISTLLTEKRLSKYLAVFDTAGINQRYFVTEPEWFQSKHGLSERNHLYMKYGIDLAEQAVFDCFKNHELHMKDLDAIISVTSTGILTPPLDVHLINRLPLKDTIRRYPLFGLGCAGGGVALSRAHDYLKANPTHSIMIVNCELATVAFHHDHVDQQNIVGAALFSDGASCTVLLGHEHPLAKQRKEPSLYIKSSSSKLLKESMDVMGWDIKNDGFYVIFSTIIPKLVRSFWKDHLEEFLIKEQIDFKEIEYILAHPGGRKVLEEVEKIMFDHQMLDYSKEVLKQYGNMSSPTVLFVIKQALESRPFKRQHHLVTALGPGFTSEILLMEWK